MLISPSMSTTNKDALLPGSFQNVLIIIVSARHTTTISHCIDC